MNGPISPKAHGIIDYTTSAAFALAPLALKRMLHMKGKHGMKTKYFFWGLAAFTGVVALMTNWSGRPHHTAA